MSLQNVIAFGNALATNETMATELEAAIKSGSGSPFGDIAAFAGARGYEVTAAEVEQGYEALQKSRTGGTDELSETELEIVSGGKGSVTQTLDNAIDQAFNRLKESGNRFNSMLDGIMTAVQDRANSFPKFR